MSANYLVESTTIISKLVPPHQWTMPIVRWCFLWPLLSHKIVKPIHNIFKTLSPHLMCSTTNSRLNPLKFAVIGGRYLSRTETHNFFFLFCLIDLYAAIIYRDYFCCCCCPLLSFDFVEPPLLCFFFCFLTLICRVWVAVIYGVLLQDM